MSRLLQFCLAFVLVMVPVLEATAADSTAVSLLDEGRKLQSQKQLKLAQQAFFRALKIELSERLQKGLLRLSDEQAVRTSNLTSFSLINQ